MRFDTTRWIEWKDFNMAVITFKIITDELRHIDRAGEFAVTLIVGLFLNICFLALLPIIILFGLI